MRARCKGFRAPVAKARTNGGQPARVDLVTADGSRMRVDAGGEPEFFWRLRGAVGTLPSLRASSTASIPSIRWSSEAVKAALTRFPLCQASVFFVSQSKREANASIAHVPGDLDPRPWTSHPPGWSAQRTSAASSLISGGTTEVHLSRFLLQDS